MNEMIRSVKFLYQYQSRKHFPVEIVPCGGDDPALKRAMMFFPIRKKQGGRVNDEVILMVHGMTMYGNMDPRYVNLCKSLAGCGYTVVLPLFKEIRDLIITPASLDQIKSVIASITSNRELCPRGELSLFTNSFSGGMCLLACADGALAVRVRSVCMIGSYSDIESSMEYLMGDQRSDPYGRFIVLKNFLKYSIDVPVAVAEAIDVFIRDHFYEREGRKPALPALLKRMNPYDHSLFKWLETSPAFRMHHWVQIRKHPDVAGMMTDFSLCRHLHEIKSSVLLIHGTDDAVIHPDESVRLYNDLRGHGIKAKLLLTPLIMAHSNLNFSLQFITQAFELFNGLNFYFRSA